MPEVKNCLTCKWCGPWSEEDGHDNRWAYCQYPTHKNLPTCVVEVHKARLIDMQREFCRIGFCTSPSSYIGYINACPTYQPKEQE